MARLDEEEALDKKLTLDGDENCRLTIINQLDRDPKDELCSRDDILQFANLCCQLYDFWVNHPEEFRLGHETPTKRRQTLLPLSCCAHISLRFNSEDALTQAINQRPDTWFAFLRYLSHSLHQADLHIEAQSMGIENLRSTNEDLCSGLLPNTIASDKKKRYHDLKSKLGSTSIQEEADSDDEYLNQSSNNVNTSRVISNPSSPGFGNQLPTVKPELVSLLRGSTDKTRNCRPPDKMDVFDGVDREKYDEWVDKLLGQFKTHEGWFVNEDRALVELDRAFRAHDTRRDAKTKLETLRMGNHETFCDFFAKFQIQINKLNYHNDDKIDELKARLNGRFASRIILGHKDTYEELINHCYSLDSELKMYEAKKTNSSNIGPRHYGGSAITIPKPSVDHTTVELGKTFKPLSQMSLKELKEYRNNLPRSAVIKQRLIDEKRFHRCMQKGHTGLDSECEFNRLPPSENFKNQQKAQLNQISISDKGKDVA
ncbi:hypothetical protein OnM2_020095 [Erysiphe neolycopersici]|uniref:Retrotransposon gag domain-containing protein n=1 Tax=Erysiphe neolycopersici TaxID=212602 RepID=A0A420I3I8_9PEZI|nr:hypothetical protein OnM2_020095 [Erysiphe neolycopersici]